MKQISSKHFNQNRRISKNLPAASLEGLNKISNGNLRRIEESEMAYGDVSQDVKILNESSKYIMQGQTNQLGSGSSHSRTLGQLITNSGNFNINQ